MLCRKEDTCLCCCTAPYKLSTLQISAPAFPAPSRPSPLSLNHITENERKNEKNEKMKKKKEKRKKKNSSDNRSSEDPEYLVSVYPVQHAKRAFRRPRSLLHSYSSTHN